jgi:hypothetical protein
MTNPRPMGDIELRELVRVPQGRQFAGGGLVQSSADESISTGPNR